LSELDIGWKEWVSLPDLNIPAIKAKVDTGARTSSLHASHITTVEKASGPWVQFVVHPLRKHPEIDIQCEAKLLDRRNIKDSGGHVENRYVIETDVTLGARNWTVVLTLTDRKDMLFRMLLGRTALGEDFKIYPGRKYLTGKIRPKKYYPIREKEGGR